MDYDWNLLCNTDRRGPARVENCRQERPVLGEKSTCLRPLGWEIRAADTKEHIPYELPFILGWDRVWHAY
jgi:hypothetical protein